MTIPSSRDLEQLSAYLDGQLSQSSRARLEIRIQADPALASALAELRQTRTILRRTPQRRAPRNFSLTPGMAGIRPPVPRLVPVLSWASAVAMLFFIFTLGAGLVGQLSFGAAATSAAAPMGSGAGPLAAAPVIMAAPATAAPATLAPATAAPATMAPVVAAPAPLAPATPVPTSGSSNPPAANQTLLPAPTEQPSILSVEQATPPAVARVFQSPAVPKTAHKPVDLWLFIWPGLAVLLGASAILAWALNKRAFQRKNPRG
jgi:hypothetical protein